MRMGGWIHAPMYCRVDVLCIVCTVFVTPVDSTGDDVAASLKKLGRQRITRVFTQLRKIAQHPLLVRALVDDAALEGIITTAARRCAWRNMDCIIVLVILLLCVALGTCLVNIMHPCIIWRNRTHAV